MLGEDLNSLNEEQEEVVDSQNDDSSEVSLENSDDDTSSKTSEVADPKQSQEDNAKYAAARKEAERQAREVETKYKKDQEIARKYSKDYNVFSEDDIKSTYNMSLDEFEQALLHQQYKQAGLDPNLINQAIANNPLIKEAQQYVSQTRQQQAQEQIKRDIEILHNDVPGTDHIKSVDDLYADPKWKDIYSLIERGYDMPDAYFKVYKNDIINNKQKNVVKSTIADIADRSRRGIERTSDYDIDPQSVLSSEGLLMAKEMGVNPKNVAKRLASKNKK